MLLLLWPFFRCHSCRFRVADGAGNGEWELRAPLLVCGNVAAISVAAAVAFCYALFTALMRDLGLAYTLNGGTVCVSNPLACNLSVSSSNRIGVCAELPLSLSRFFCASRLTMWFIKNSSKSAPASGQLCACLLGRLPSINRRHQSKRIESQASSVSVSVSGLSPRLLHSVICFAV